MAEGGGLPLERRRARVRGAVQGVGFRPHVYSLAAQSGLSGWVLNDAEGVLLEVEGAGLDAFFQALEEDAPPLARIDKVEAVRISPRGTRAFEIRASASGKVMTAIGPDAAVCDACLEELFDPADRRYRYPFLNCTHCGPRYTLTRSLPYDRANTSMAAFPLCGACRTEYENPADRRFHAQPTACPDCGPHLNMRVDEILAAVSRGEIVAVKGLGGFHLACDARNAGAVALIRQRKDREEKPFAIMVANIESARQLALLTEAEEALLQQRERPIVLARAREGAGLAPAIAPGLADIGLVLPYTPLHYLIFHEAAGRPDGTGWLDEPQATALVMTSANPGGEPLVIGDSEARDRLSGIADHIAGHDRDIVIRADDSVVRVVAGAPVFLRRARGFTPQPIKLPRSVPPILAVGGHLNTTVCLTRGDEAFLSQHIGDLDNDATYTFFLETIEHLEAILEIEPQSIACDRHPDFLSTRYAEARGLPVRRIQHHHAHIAAVAAEHGMEGPLLGLALDGFGLGDDGTAWGGELLLVDAKGAHRLGRLSPLAEAGGDRAAREPWRMAAAALHAIGRGDEIATRFADEAHARGVAALIAAGAPVTSGAGRYFDAAAGLLSVSRRQAYEGHAPMLLESLVRTPQILERGWRIVDGDLDLSPLLAALADETDAIRGAELFHGAFAAAVADWAGAAARSRGLETVALGGGCFVNRFLAEGAQNGLTAQGLNVLTARAAPPGDGGLSLGQAWAAAMLIEGE